MNCPGCFSYLSARAVIGDCVVRHKPFIGQVLPQGGERGRGSSLGGEGCRGWKRTAKSRRRREDLEEEVEEEEVEVEEVEEEVQVEEEEEAVEVEEIGRAHV